MRSNDFTSQKLKIQHSSGKVFTGQVQYCRVDDITRKWNLLFTSPVTKTFETVNWNLFECLVDLRRELARFSYQPLCNGARKDIFLSGMCGDMGEGHLGYIIQLEERMDTNDLVHILDYAAPHLIASIEEQEAFIEDWLYPGGKYTPIEHKLKIKNRKGEITEGQLLVYSNNKPSKIEFKLPQPILDLEYTGADFWECLTNLRTKLDGLELVPLCNGARIDAHMFLDEIEMFEGTRCRILMHGKIPHNREGIEIFDGADPSLVGSIQEQQDFYLSWLESLIHLSPAECRQYHRGSYPDEFFLRLVPIGGLLKMWIFEVDDESQEQPLKALSPLSYEDVDRIGELKSEAIVGFFRDGVVSASHFRFVVNKKFVDFMHEVIATKALDDISLHKAATTQKEGWIYIIDERALGEPEVVPPRPENVIGAFTVESGKIISGSYLPNEKYIVFAYDGLFQLTPFLYTALLEELREL